MKKKMARFAAFGAFSLTVVAAMPAHAQFSVQSKKTAGADQTTHISEDLTVTSTSSPVDGLRVNYYMYEANPPSIKTWTVTPTTIGSDRSWGWPAFRS